MLKNISHPIIFIRHGETDWNELGRYQGSTNTHLSSKGLNSADVNGKLTLKLLNNKLLQKNNLTLVSSPLMRAHQTAEHIANQIQHTQPIHIEPAFQELSMGRWQGLTSQQVKDKFYEERKSRKLNRWTFKPEGGESMADRSLPLDNALSALKKDTIVITHSVVLRIILHLLGGRSCEAAAQENIPHQGVFLWDGTALHHYTHHTLPIQ